MFLYRYNIELVPTIIDEFSSDEPANQYSVASSEKEIVKYVTKKHPLISFDFDTAPIAVKFVQEKKGLVEFITQLCAMVGGGFTLGGFIDSFVFRVNNRKND